MNARLGLALLALFLVGCSSTNLVFENRSDRVLSVRPIGSNDEIRIEPGEKINISDASMGIDILTSPLSSTSYHPLRPSATARGWRTPTVFYKDHALRDADGRMVEVAGSSSYNIQFR